MANSLSNGHKSPRRQGSASCSSYCSLGTRWKESRTGCPAFLSKFIVIEGDKTAKQISDILKEEIGWNMNTTYTVIKKCMAKGAIERSEPNFMCHALIPKEVVQEAEAEELIGKLFDGSPDKLFAALLDNQKLSREQIENLRRMVAELE